MGKAESTELTEAVRYTVKSQTGINRDYCERKSSCRLGRAGYSNTMPVTGFRSKFRMRLGGSSRVAKPNAFENSGNQNDYQTKNPFHLPNYSVVFPHVVVLTLSLASPNVPKALGFATPYHLPNGYNIRTTYKLLRTFYHSRSTQPTKTEQ